MFIAMVAIGEFNPTVSTNKKRLPNSKSIVAAIHLVFPLHHELFCGSHYRAFFLQLSGGGHHRSCSLLEQTCCLCQDPLTLPNRCLSAIDAVHDRSEPLFIHRRGAPRHNGDFILWSISRARRCRRRSRTFRFNAYRCSRPRAAVIAPPSASRAAVPAVMTLIC